MILNFILVATQLMTAKNDIFGNAQHYSKEVKIPKSYLRQTNCV